MPPAAPAQKNPGIAEESTQSYGPALTLLASLFFMWGFITVINNTLLPHLRSGVVLANRVPRPQSSGVRFVTVEPVKMSGFGAHGGARGLATYTRVQAAILNMA